MRVVVNTIPLLSPLTGVGKYTWQICRSMAETERDNEYFYYYGYYSRQLYCANQSGRSIASIKDAIKGIPLLGRSLRRLKAAGAALSRERFDIYFEPNYILLPIRARKAVATIPDFSVFLHPEWHRRDVVEYFRSHFFRNIGRADRLIVMSNFIRDTAISEFGFDPDRIATIPLGCDHRLFHRYEASALEALYARYNLPRQFILYVGSIEPRKNLSRLLDAYRRLPLSLRRDIKLVLAGFSGWENADVMELLKALENDVCYIGYVDEADLAGLYSLARVFVYPALYEGFGLPPLEAMACGCPVVVSRVASLPEVCGEAAVYVDPLDIEQISSQLEQLLDDDAQLARMRVAGQERARDFSWTKAASAHLHVFRNLND